MELFRWQIMLAFGVKIMYCSSNYSISKAIVSLLPSPCRATALSAARRLDTIDLEMELQFMHKVD